MYSAYSAFPEVSFRNWTPDARCAGPLHRRSVMAWISAGMIDTLAVNAALLPSGHIIYFGGSDYNPDNHARVLINHTRLYDCEQLDITPVDSPTTDVFCCGH